MAASNTSTPSLSQFAQTRLASVYTAVTEADFNAAFEALFVHQLEVTLNGKRTTREYFKQQLWSDMAQYRSVTVDFPGVVEVPMNAESSDKAGTVGLFLTANATSQQGTRERISASYKLNIIQDKVHAMDVVMAENRGSSSTRMG